ncbi:MAG: lysophospholipid acyltransferase family protein [Pseudomonadota bacterium]
MALRDLLSRENDPLASEEALRDHINRVLSSQGGRDATAKLIDAVARRWFKTTVFNTELVPNEPCLFIGNHALFGLDGFVVIPALRAELNRNLRPMGDKFLFSEPRIANRLIAIGATIGHPEVARALMQRGEDLLVFPGGAHEAVKAQRYRYQLQWKERLGFVRLAMEANYPIVPFGLVGPDDFYSYLLDSEDLVRFFERAGLWPRQLRKDIVPPLLRGMFGGPIPRPQPCYLSFAEPVSFSDPDRKQILNSRPNAQSKRAERTLRSYRKEVALRIKAEIKIMLEVRKEQRSKLGVLRRLATF